MNIEQLATQIIEIGGPVVTVTILITAGYIWLLKNVIQNFTKDSKESQQQFIDSIQSYPKQMQSISNQSQETNKELQKNYQEQIEKCYQQNRTLAKEVTIAIIDNTKALQELKHEIHHNHS